MPRGGSGKGGHNSIMGDNNITANRDELSALSRYALNIFQQKTPDLHNPKEVEQAVIDYFNNCADNGIRPANLGLYASLGMTRQDVDDVLRGKNKSKVSHDCIDIIKRAKVALSSYREGLAMSGKVNPVTAIFWSKNFDGMSDVQTIEVTTDKDDVPMLTQDDINKRIPVYSDTEIDNE